MTWVLGTDTDIPARAALLGGGLAGAVTIGQALHWMNDRDLFPALCPRPAARSGAIPPAP